MTAHLDPQRGAPLAFWGGEGVGGLADSVSVRGSPPSNKQADCVFQSKAVHDMEVIEHDFSLA